MPWRGRVRRVAELRNFPGQAHARVWGATAIILFSATYLQKWLGTRVLTAIERLMGMVIVAISVQMLLDGIASYLRAGT